MKTISWDEGLIDKNLRIYFDTMLRIGRIKSVDDLWLNIFFLLSDVFPDGNGIDKDIEIIDFHFIEMLLIEHGEKSAAYYSISHFTTWWIVDNGSWESMFS